MKLIAFALLILFLIPVIPIQAIIVTSTTKTTEPLVPIVQTQQKVHTVTPGQFAQDLGSNTLQTTPEAFSFYRPGGNFSIGAVALTVNGESIALSNPNGGLFPQGLSNSTVTEYLYDQSVVILPNTYHAHLELYLKDIQGSYNREIILKGSGDVNGVPMNPNSPLAIQFVNPQGFKAAICNQSGSNNPTDPLASRLPCTQQLFGNMGISLGCSQSSNVVSSSYNNSTLTETFNVNDNFFCDPLAIDGTGDYAGGNPVSLTTSNPNDIILVRITTTSENGKTCGTTAQTVSDTASLTWHCRSIISINVPGQSVYEMTYFYAVSSGTLSGDSITVNGVTPLYGSAFGVSGADTSTIFDTNGSACNGTGSYACQNSDSSGALNTPSIVLSTSNANDMIVLFNDAGGGTYSTPTGYTVVIGGKPYDGTYKVLSATITTQTQSYTATESYWVIIADAIRQNPGVTQPIAITVDNSGASATFTITNCSPSPSTIVTDGATHNIVANPSCTLTITVVADTTNIHYRYSGGGTTTTVATCASGTCSLASKTVYEELQNTYQATPVGPTVWDAVYSIPVKGTVAGAGSTTGCSIVTTSGGGAASCAAFFDFNRLVTVTASLGSWSPFPTGSNTFTQTTGGNTNNVNYVIASSGGGGGSTEPTYILVVFLIFLAGGLGIYLSKRR